MSGTEEVVSVQLSDEQCAEIQQMLGEGLSPRGVADSIGRVAGLGPVEVLELESAIEELHEPLS